MKHLFFIIIALIFKIGIAQDTLQPSFIELNGSAGYSRYFTRKADHKWYDKRESSQFLFTPGVQLAYGKQIRSNSFLKIGIEFQFIEYQEEIKTLIFPDEIGSANQENFELTDLRSKSAYFSIPITYFIKPSFKSPFEFGAGLRLNKEISSRLTEYYSDGSNRSTLFTKQLPLEIGYQFSVQYQVKLNTQFSAIIGLSHYKSFLELRRNQDILYYSFFEKTGNYMSNLGLRYSF